MIRFRAKTVKFQSLAPNASTGEPIERLNAASPAQQNLSALGRWLARFASYLAPLQVAPSRCSTSLPAPSRQEQQSWDIGPPPPWSPAG